MVTVPAKVEQGQTQHLSSALGPSQSTNHSQRYWKGQKEPTALLIGRQTTKAKGRVKHITS